jgi:hypothetical protein
MLFMKKVLYPLFVFGYSIILISCSKNGLSRSDSSSTGFSSSTDGMPAASAGAGSSSGGGGNSQPGVITAAEWNDLANWDFWNTVIQRDTINTFPPLWGFYTNHRISVTLKDASNKLIHDAVINLESGGKTYTARTDNFGKAELFPGIFNNDFQQSAYSLNAIYNGQSFNLGFYNFSQTNISKTIPVTKVTNKTLDILFAVDATGSMGDEISYLKKELQDVVNRAGNELAGTEIRMGSVFYRDNGDTYVTKPFDFTTNSASLVNFIGEQNADGGGDFPEAVDQALEVATNNMDWSKSAINRLIFLILDAPPHDTQAEIDRTHNAVVKAQEKGIRIIPVSASGIDRSTEFILRFLSVTTNSTYVFITDDSGIGNPHLKPTVGNYTAEYLNNLMVRLISKYGKDNN